MLFLTTLGNYPEKTACVYLFPPFDNIYLMFLGLYLETHFRENIMYHNMLVLKSYQNILTE